MLYALKGQSASDVIFALWNVWRPIHGIPTHMLSDRGKGFIAQCNLELYKIFGINKLFTSSYHPETNAKAERGVQEAKKALRLANITLDGELTDDKNQFMALKEIEYLLPSIQFSLNQKLKSFVPVSSNMLLFGKNMRDIPHISLTLKQLRKLKGNKDFFKFICYN